MRILCLLLCLFMLWGSAQAAVSVRMQDTAALLQESGEEIVPAGQYSDIVSLGANLFAAGNGAGYGLMDQSGILLSQMVYDGLQFAQGIVIACMDSGYGLLDVNGNEISGFDYSCILPAEEDRFWALKGSPDDQQSDEIFILNADGTEKATELFVRSIGQPADGLLPVLLPESGMWGYCNAEGKLTVPAVYSHAGKFIAGRAAVVQNGNYGAINKNGSFVVPPEYGFLEISESGFVLAVQNAQGVHVFDLNGYELAFYAGEETYAMLLGGGYGIVNEGELKIYDARNALLETLAWDAAVTEGLNGQLIVSDGAWGETCVYLLGTSVRYQNLFPLGTDGEETLYACMQVHAARYVSDLLDEIQYAVDMEMARYGVVNSKGEMLIPCEYESIEYLGNGRLLRCGDGVWQMCTANGEVLWQYGTKQTEEPSAEADF